MTKKTKVLIMIAVCWGLFIFANSLMNGEMSAFMSDSVAFRFPKWLISLIGDTDTLIMLVRKNAHFLEYMVLGILVSLCYHFSGKFQLRNAGNIFFSCLFWATADEFLQTFVQGRTGKVQDVIIDFFGVLVGVMIVALVVRIRLYRKKSKQKK